MTKDMSGIWIESLELIRVSIRQLFLSHLAYAALGVTLFTPMIGILGQFLLRLSGQPAIADQDIVYFLFTPFGMLAMVIFAALLITILVFEQASMMSIGAGRIKGLHVSTMSALRFSVKRSKNIFMFAVRLVMRTLFVVLPFLAAGAVVAWLLITDHDINYYLTDRPPEFLLAITIIGLLLLTMLAVLTHKLLAWSFALPLILFGNLPPARSFVESEKLTLGHKRLISKVLLFWLLGTLLLGTLVLAGVQLLASMLPLSNFESIKWLLMILGGVVALWSLANLLTTTLTSGSFACLLLTLFRHHGSDILTDDLVTRQSVRRWRLTAFRFVLLVIASTVVATLTGTWLLNGIQVRDDVLIAAHRGAAGKAPENTLAAVRAAIDDGADWIEIDVQETSDGEVVVIHDSDLMKLSGKSLRVWDATLKELQEIDVGSWFNPDFSAERVPTLSQVLQTARGKARVLIELKYYGHDQQLEQRVVDIVEQNNMVKDIAIMSLQYSGIQKVRVLRPEWNIGLLSATAIGDLAKLDADFLAVNMNMATPGFIRRTQSAGKQVYVWTINDSVAMSRMMSMGVDGIITDEPELAQKVIAERSDLNSLERLLIHTAVLFGRPIPPRKYRDQSP